MKNIERQISNENTNNGKAQTITLKDGNKNVG